MEEGRCRSTNEKGGCRKKIAEEGKKEGKASSWRDNEE